MNEDKQTAPTNNKINDLENTFQIVEEKLTGSLQIRKYYKKKLLGKGGFAKCYEFECADNQKTFAAKVIAKSSLTKDRAKQKLISEIKIHKSLHQQNIVAFEHYFEDPENVYILLEICDNRTLNELLKRRKTLTELEVQCYIVQLIKALKYLHTHRVIHRDLKLGNLFLNDKMELKVGDFGLATKLDYEGEKKRTVCGTPNYIAPEILDSKTGHSYEVDIWSMGVIIYTLIIGKPPFETQDIKSTYKKIKTCSYDFPEEAKISPAAKSLIGEILVHDPSKRPTLDQILTHEFFNMGTSIPKLLPVSTLACKPNIKYIHQFMPDINEDGIIKRAKTKAFFNNDNSKIKDESTNNSSNNANNNSNSDDKHLNKKRIIKAPETFVKRWVDYSSKYGLAYLLSNGETGVHFNDYTKIVLNSNTNTFDYVDRAPNSQEDTIKTYPFQQGKYPKELHKKVTLLQHFKTYLEGETTQASSSSKGEKESPSDKKGERVLVYMRRWMRTKHAIMFRLSNKVVQVCFLDKTEILLSTDDKVVTYSNKKGEKATYELKGALESNNYEMSKRLKYTKDILAHMMKMSQQNK